MRHKLGLLAGVMALAILAAASPVRAQQIMRLCAEGESPSGQSCATTISPQVTASAVESSHVFKSTGPSNAIDFQVNNTSSSSVWVMMFDAPSAPAGGGAAIVGCTNQISARPCVAKWYQLAANSTIGVTWSPGPFTNLLTGQTVVCSSTGPFTLTYSANCTFSGEAM